MFVLFLLIAVSSGPGRPGVDSTGPAPLCLDRIVAPVRDADRWLGMDKFWHFTASFVTVGAGYHLFADRLSIDRPVSTGISIGGTLSLGLVKEFFDRRSRERHFSWKDLAFDAAGTTLGYLVFIHNY